MFVEAHEVGTRRLDDAAGRQRPHQHRHRRQLRRRAGRHLHPFLAHYQGADCSPTGTTGAWNAATGTSRRLAGVGVDLSAYAGKQVEVSISYVVRLGHPGPRRLPRRRHGRRSTARRSRRPRSRPTSAAGRWPGRRRAPPPTPTTGRAASSPSTRARSWSPGTRSTPASALEGLTPADAQRLRQARRCGTCSTVAQQPARSPTPRDHGVLAALITAARAPTSRGDPAEANPCGATWSGGVPQVAHPGVHDVGAADPAPPRWPGTATRRAGLDGVPARQCRKGASGTCAPPAFVIHEGGRTCAAQHPVHMTARPVPNSASEPAAVPRSLSTVG